jgi:AhpD family alkylhydroperoxidase
MKPQPPLKRVNSSDMSEDIASAWEASMALRGDATFFEIFANHPELYRWYVNSFYGDVFRGGKVAQPYKELLRLKLSTLHGCRFCNQGNRRDALAAGLTEAQIDAFDDPESGPFSEAEKAVLALGEQLALTKPEGILNPALHHELSAYFSDAEILELGLVGGILAGVAKFMFAYDLVEKEETCPFHPSREE